MDNARYTLDNGPGIVRLNFSRTILSDAGVWRCNVTTVSDQYVVSDGSLVQSDSTMVGVPIQHGIELIIVGEYIIYDHESIVDLKVDYLKRHNVNLSMTL